ncbi:uncharacterized protein YALI1_D22319g [Yarrowia lipolytica]|uniref:Uncharacterized protein n=1 Tax=Yarrowia lipolytica TaxID=4952 RepID=A0A1D8NF20_YARLL|nr:hypothetical protein YALI1_D22319g [Yarrowia lipolytica]
MSSLLSHIQQQPPGTTATRHALEHYTTQIRHQPRDSLVIGPTLNRDNQDDQGTHTISGESAKPATFQSRDPSAIRAPVYCLVLFLVACIYGFLRARLYFDYITPATIRESNKNIIRSELASV